jgi:hypothetical protein
MLGWMVLGWMVLGWTVLGWRAGLGVVAWDSWAIAAGQV